MFVFKGGIAHVCRKGDSLHSVAPKEIYLANSNDISYSKVSKGNKMIQVLRYANSLLPCFMREPILKPYSVHFI